MNVLRFQPQASEVDPSFWERFRSYKLDEQRLEDGALRVWGFSRAGEAKLFLTSVSFESSLAENANPNTAVCVGQLRNFNTVEEFKASDKTELLRLQGQELLEAIGPEAALPKESALMRFFILAFSDLKAYKYIYWCAFPAVLPKEAHRAIAADQTEDSVLQVAAATQELQGRLVQEGRCLPWTWLVHGATAYTFAAAEEAKILVAGQPQSPEGFVFVFLDPVGVHVAEGLGWFARNLLAFLSKRYCLAGCEVRVLSVRGRLPSGDGVLSIEGDLSDWQELFLARSRLFSVLLSEIDADAQFTGWEPNQKGRMGPRLANLSNLMDPNKLAISSADLNLRLMRWRQYPDLNVDLLSRARILLLGAGTLGCSIGRLLVGWGFRNIKIVDSGKVSYSNPTRQSLFVTTNAARSDFKSLAAAEALNQILPGMNVKGEVYRIPMPGHTTAAEADDAVREAGKLRDHIRDSDVVFMLTDSRESRWLPTLLATAEDKPMINVALGMDGFLVMRHGASPTPRSPPHGLSARPRAPRLGCYFCTDVVAATNSLSNRTLDQMCTVTRPGLAPLASAMAVELLVSMLQHPQRHKAPPAPSPVVDRVGPLPLSESQQPWATQLGALPHQIRFFLSSFSLMTPTIESFDCCTACSPAVINAYTDGGMDWVAEMLQDPSKLEKISGVQQLREVEVEIDWDDDEDIDFQEENGEEAVAAIATDGDDTDGFGESNEMLKKLKETLAEDKKMQKKEPGS